MKLFIPPIGALITLQKDWVFTLYNEYRNQGLIIALNLGEEVWIKKDPNSEWGHKITTVRLPAGTVLAIDRIYIKKGVRDYNSVTFIVKSSPIVKGRKPRFWAKLPDVNRIEIKDSDLVIHKLVRKDKLNG